MRPHRRAGFLGGVTRTARPSPTILTSPTPNRCRAARGGPLVLGGGFAGILGQVPGGLARSAARTLGRNGIEIVTGVGLEAVDASGAVLADGRRIATETIVWTGGVAPNPLAARLGLLLDESGRVAVDETLRVAGLEHVWALGACAAVPSAATPGVTDPATCQHALRQARRLARNLRARLPAAWTRLRFRIQVREQLIEVDMTPAGTAYRLLEGRGIMIQHFGEPLRLTPGAPVHRLVPGADEDPLPLAA